MNKRKLVNGIFIIVIGAILMGMSLIFGIGKIIGEMYEDIENFKIIMSHGIRGRTATIYLTGPQQVSAWLKMPNREIENKRIKVSVSLVAKNGSSYGEVAEDFKHGYFRNSAGEGQYYKLGQYEISDFFEGNIEYKIEGTWTTSHPGEIVLRIGKKAPAPVIYVIGLVVGIVILVVGIDMLETKG